MFFKKCVSLVKIPCAMHNVQFYVIVIMQSLYGNIDSEKSLHSPRPITIAEGVLQYEIEAILHYLGQSISVILVYAKDHVLYDAT